MLDNTKIMGLLQLLKRFKKFYGYEYFMTGSYREGENILYSDIDFVLIGGNYPVELMELVNGLGWISLTHFKRPELEVMNYKSKNCLRILDPYFRDHLKDVYFESSKVLDLHLASFYSLVRTYKDLREKNFLEQGIPIKTELVFRHFRLFDRYVFSLFDEDPFLIFQKPISSLTPRLKEKKYIIQKKELSTFTEEIQVASGLLEKEFERALKKLESNKYYHNLLDPSYIQDIRQFLITA